ncbi:hypothetical protein [Dyadobacter sp. NIV53]|uniref:hypothetical protein n=1 Tax=Dyadobacter sp. NIV53 TaxID=2861765 RepID=UPI001C88BA3D|nr:hypothetical protein [Dyadobacter sp. NIV53]
MDLILKTDSADKAAKVIAFAKKLNISVETIEKPVVDLAKREELKKGYYLSKQKIHREKDYRH